MRSETLTIKNECPIMENKKQVSVIIPFYNEEPRIIHVLRVLTQVPHIDQIICVDDGSTDNGARLVKLIYPDVEVVQLSHNQGKTEAIAQGFKRVVNDYVLLFDADLQDVRVHEVETGVHAMMCNPMIDMLIFRLNDPDLWSTIRSDIVLSGNRLLKRKDLEQILALRPDRYQIEFMTNKYMIQYNKQVFWAASSAMQTFKVEKFGLFEGAVREIEMSMNIFSRYSVLDYVKQMLFFCTDEVPKTKVRYVSSNRSSKTWNDALSWYARDVSDRLWERIYQYTRTL